MSLADKLISAVTFKNLTFKLVLNLLKSTVDKFVCSILYQMNFTSYVKCMINSSVVKLVLSVRTANKPMGFEGGKDNFEDAKQLVTVSLIVTCN